MIGLAIQAIRIGLCFLLLRQNIPEAFNVIGSVELGVSAFFVITGFSERLLPCAFTVHFTMMFVWAIFTIVVICEEGGKVERAVAICNILLGYSYGCPLLERIPDKPTLSPRNPQCDV